MSKWMRNFFISLSQNYFLNKYAQKYGYKLFAQQFVGGRDLPTVMQTVHQLNEQQISCTVDHLGEFVTDRKISLAAKDNIIALLKEIANKNADCHISVKLTQLGLDIDEEFCLSLMQEILQVAEKNQIFVNIDTEDFAHYEATIRIFKALQKQFTLVGTVVQSYYYHADEMMDEFRDSRLRIVKGAYKESNDLAYQTKEEIDANFLRLAKKRLRGNAFTSIATHDHHIINELKEFITTHQIDKNNFEFQMLYGFRIDLQASLVKEGYLFCTYIPYGEDWYGYFMRRLAERPQNIQLIIKDKLYHDDHRIKKAPILLTTALMTTLFFILQRGKK